MHTCCLVWLISFWTSENWKIKGEKVLFKTGNIIQFIKDIYLQFKELSTTKNIDFTLETSVDYLLINYDHDMMYKIINNLLSNAFKFTPQNGHIQLTVNKADRNDKEYIMIEVSDTGCGIDEKTCLIYLNASTR